MAVSELNHMVDQWRASYGNAGDVSALSYGYKVITLLTGVIIVPLTTIMFSRMSRLVAENDRRGILQIVRNSTVTIAMVMTPIIAICAVGNQDVIKALYLSGEFDLDSAAVTAGVFLFYVIGVLGFGLRDLAQPHLPRHAGYAHHAVCLRGHRRGERDSQQHSARAYGRARPGAGHHHFRHRRHAGAVLSAPAQDAPFGAEKDCARYRQDLLRVRAHGDSGLGAGQPHARGRIPACRRSCACW